MEHLANIVEEHLHEGPFLWERWERVLVAHDQDPARAFSHTEDRLLGHVAGVCAVGSAAIDLVAPLLADEEERWAPAFAAHVLALVDASDARAALTAVLYAASSERAAAIGRGVQLARPSALLPTLEADLAAARPDVQVAILGLRCALSLPPSPAVWAILDAGDERARAAVLRLARFAQGAARDGAARAVEQALASSMVAVRNAAIEAGLVLGNPTALACARDVVARGAPGAGALLPLLGVLLRDGDGLAVQALANEELRADALIALGYAGTAAAAQACVEALAQQIHPALATEAFAAITGFEVPPLDLPDDTPPAAFDAPGALQPMADAPSVIRWWNANRSRFAAGTRYVGGKARSLDVVRDGLTFGPMRRRATLAFEVRIRSGGKVDVQTSDFIGNQRRQMAALAGLSVAELQRQPIARSLAPL